MSFYFFFCVPFSRSVTPSRFQSWNLKVFVKDFQISESFSSSRSSNFSGKILLNWPLRGLEILAQDSA